MGSQAPLTTRVGNYLHLRGSRIPKSTLMSQNLNLELALKAPKPASIPGMRVERANLIKTSPFLKKTELKFRETRLAIWEVFKDPYTIAPYIEYERNCINELQTALKNAAEEAGKTSERLFPGSSSIFGRVKESIVSSSWLPYTLNFISQEKGSASPSAVYLAFALSTVTLAIAAAATNVGFLPLSLGLLTISSYAAKHLKKDATPGTLGWRLSDLGERIFPLTIGGWGIYLSSLFLNVDLNVLKTFAHSLISINPLFPLTSFTTVTFPEFAFYLVPFGSLLLTGAFTYYKYQKDLKSMNFTNGADGHPLTQEQIVKTLRKNYLGIFGELNYLLTRTTLYGAALAQITSSLAKQGLEHLILFPFLVVPLAFRAFDHKYQLTDKLLLKLNWINSDWSKENPISSLLLEYFTKITLRYGALVGGVIGFSDLGFGFFFPFLTLHLGGWTIFADWHSGSASLGSAIRHINSLFNSPYQLISDAFKNGLKGIVARVNPYVKDSERNYAKIINMMVSKYPYLEHIYCGELDPYESGNLAQLQVRSKIHNFIKQLQRENYGILARAYYSLIYESPEAKFYSEINKLILCFEELGNKFVNQIGDKIENFVKTKGSASFDLTKEEHYLRECKNALRIQGETFYQIAEKLKRKANLGLITSEELKDLYIKWLNIFDQDFIPLARKLDKNDSNIPTKINNLKNPITHRGDMLYKAWIINGNPTANDRVGGFVSALWIRFRNPNYDHTANTKKYVYLKREDVLKLLGLSQSTTDEIAFVNNKPKGNEESISSIMLGGEEFENLQGIYSNEEAPAVTGIILSDEARNNPNKYVNKFVKINNYYGKFTLDTSNNLTVSPISITEFRGKLEKWGEKIFYDKDDPKKWEDHFKKWLEWYENEPKFMAFSPADYFVISDEGYVDWNSAIEHQAELEWTKQKDRILRIWKYKPWKAEMPNPDPTRKIAEVKNWHILDAPMGIRYKDQEGNEFCVPFSKYRENFLPKMGDKVKKKDPKTGEEKELNKKIWETLSHGVVVKENGKQVIYVFDKEGKRQDSWIIGEDQVPTYMHPLEELGGEDIEIETASRKKLVGKRIDLELFPRQVGFGTWLVADYGENYGKEDHQRYRFALLSSPPTKMEEGKQEFWSEFITKMILSPDTKRITFEGVAPRVHRYPINTQWTGLKEDFEIIKEENNSNLSHAWLLVKNGDQKEVFTVPLESLPKSLKTPFASRRVIEVQKKENSLLFVKLRSKNSAKEKPDFLYTLKENQDLDNDTQTNLRKLDVLLNNQDFTVKIEKSGASYSLKVLNDREEEIFEFSSQLFKDFEGKDFLSNLKSKIASLENIYTSNSYSKDSPEYYLRPRLMKIDGEIVLAVTRVEKIEVSNLDNITAKDNGHKLSRYLDTINEASSKMYFAIPTSIVTIKRGQQTEEIPLTLTEPLELEDGPPDCHLGKAEIVTTESNCGNIKKIYEYKSIKLPRNLPKDTYLIKKEEGQFYAYTLKVVKKDDNNIKIEEEKLEKVELDIEDEEIAKSNEVKISVSYLWGKDILKGNYQMVVHRQNQQGGTVEGESFTSGLIAQWRDEYFYGIIRSLFADVIPPKGWPRSVSLQQGNLSYDKNDLSVENPIESGTPLMAAFKDAAATAAISMGLPPGAILQYGLYLEKYGGIEKILNHPNFIKAHTYFRELGWSAGVSEDEQWKAAVMMILGINLKFSQRSTSFESQPNVINQVIGQDWRRYNYAMQLAKDVQIPNDLHTISEWICGRSLHGTWMEKYANVLFRSWYEVPKAEIARQLSPIVYLLSLGQITPYPVDKPWFLFSWALKFTTGLNQYTFARFTQARNKGQSGYSALNWAFFKGQKMSVAFLYPGLKEVVNFYRENSQYGGYVTTALQKLLSMDPKNIAFLQYLITLHLLAITSGLLMPFSLGWELAIPANLVWSVYMAYILQRTTRLMKDATWEEKLLDQNQIAKLVKIDFEEAIKKNDLDKILEHTNKLIDTIKNKAIIGFEFKHQDIVRETKPEVSRMGVDLKKQEECSSRLDELDKLISEYNSSSEIEKAIRNLEGLERQLDTLKKEVRSSRSLDDLNNIWEESQKLLKEVPFDLRYRTFRSELLGFIYQREGDLYFTARKMLNNETEKEEGEKFLMDFNDKAISNDYKILAEEKLKRLRQGVLI